MKTKEELQPLFDEIDTIISLKDVSNGVDQDVTLVTCENDSYIYKEPKKDFAKLDNEVLGCALAEKLGIPAPKIIKQTSTFLIETLIRGGEIANNVLSDELYFFIGQCLKKLHSEPAPYVGEKQWGCTSHKDRYYEDMPENISVVADYFKNEEIKSYFENNLHYLDYSPVYIHGDFGDDHVFYDGDTITGFIDWADLYGGIPEFEFGRYYAFHQDKNKFLKILKGYGPIDMKAARFFSLYTLTWYLASKIKNNEELSEYYKNHYLNIFQSESL